MRLNKDPACLGNSGIPFGNFGTILLSIKPHPFEINLNNLQEQSILDSKVDMIMKYIEIPGNILNISLKFNKEK